MSCPATIARILHKEGIEKAQSTTKKAHEEYAGVTLNLHAFYNDVERGFLHVSQGLPNVRASESCESQCEPCESQCEPCESCKLVCEPCESHCEPCDSCKPGCEPRESPF